MENYTVQLALVAVLVLTNAVFAGSEIALVTLRESQLRQLERRGAGGRAVARLARDPNRFLATIQIGITLAGFLASATAAVSLAQPLIPPLSTVFGTAAPPVAIVLVTVALTFITLVFGDGPERIAMQRAETWCSSPGRSPCSCCLACGVAQRSTDLVVRSAEATRQPPGRS